MAKGWNDGTWSVRFADYLDRGVTLTVPYNTSTLAISNPGLTCVRDPGCLFDTLIVGRVEDGTRRTWPIPEGTTNVNRAQLAQEGFSTIQNVTDAGVTMGRSTP